MDGDSDDAIILPSHCTLDPSKFSTTARIPDASCATSAWIVANIWPSTVPAWSTTARARCTATRRCPSQCRLRNCSSDGRPDDSIFPDRQIENSLNEVLHPKSMTIRSCTNLWLDDLIPAYWNGKMTINTPNRMNISISNLLEILHE